MISTVYLKKGRDQLTREVVEVSGGQRLQRAL